MDIIYVQRRGVAMSWKSEITADVPDVWAGDRRHFPSEEEAGLRSGTGHQVQRRAGLARGELRFTKARFPGRTKYTTACWGPPMSLYGEFAAREVKRPRAAEDPALSRGPKCAGLGDLQTSFPCANGLAVTGAASWAHMPRITSAQLVFMSCELVRTAASKRF